jgi:RNA recognition motif-containing protein
MNIYVGNLSFDVSGDDLREIFEKFGEVTEARLIIDKFSGKSKGFGFIEMPSKQEAEKAIEEMNGEEFKERVLSVSEAKPKTDRRRRGRSGARGKRGGRKKRGGKKRRGVYGGEDRDDFSNRRRGSWY